MQGDRIGLGHISEVQGRTEIEVGGGDGSGRSVSVMQAWSTDVSGLSVSRQATGLALVTEYAARVGIARCMGLAREGHKGCEATDWVSDTWVRCKTG